VEGSTRRALASLEAADAGSGPHVRVWELSVASPQKSIRQRPKEFLKALTALLRTGAGLAEWIDTAAGLGGDPELIDIGLH
jgi:hypothetical protein